MVPSLSQKVDLNVFKMLMFIESELAKKGSSPIVIPLLIDFLVLMLLKVCNKCYFQVKKENLIHGKSKSFSVLNLF